jgi:GNAT superfamily N-acetyltransferase
MSGDSEVTIRPISKEDVLRFSAFHAKAHSGCFCRFFHFTGDKNAWLLQASASPEQNQAESEAALASGDPTSFGVIAEHPKDGMVGWLKVAPDENLQKLRQLPVYRPLALAPEQGSWTIGCMLVAETHRRKGIARALLQGAIQFCREQGARQLVALPRTEREGVLQTSVHDAFLAQGVQSSLLAEGFVHARGEHPHPVMVLKLVP